MALTDPNRHRNARYHQECKAAAVRASRAEAAKRRRAKKGLPPEFNRPCPRCGGRLARANARACATCLAAWECEACGEVKPHAANGLCHGCNKNKWRADNSARHRAQQREWFLLKKYNLTLARYFEILEAQDNACGNKVCGKPAPDPDTPGRRLFHVDHDHACCPGEGSCGRCVRGILCYSCNQLLGNARDEAGILRGAAEYLDRWNAV